MNFLRVFIIITMAIFVVTCSSMKHLEPTKARQLKPSEVRAYHNPIELNIAWVPYEDLALKQTKDNNWVMVKSDSAHTSAVPIIMITYPNTNDSIWIDMNIKNELLGKLIKHTLMTQMPITEPFGDYLEQAKCTRCHPSNIKVNFDR